MKEQEMAEDMFPAFAKSVARAFQDLVKGPSAFVADVEGDALYAQYLAAFPEGTNPIFKKNTEHDCSCCRQFIRRAGAVVAIVEGDVSTVWDQAAAEAPAPYKAVATTLRDTVKAAGVKEFFRVGQNETSFGAKQSRSLDPETQQALTWNHLHTGEVPRNYRAASPDQVRGDYRTTTQVFERGLIELDPEAIERFRDRESPLAGGGEP